MSRTYEPAEHVMYATKGYTDVKPARRKDILGCTKLIGRTVKMMVPGEDKITPREVTIRMIYPYMAEGTYKAGKDGEYEFNIGLSIADLIASGLLTFERGFPEVI